VSIVLDTNVLVAGLLSGTGPPAWIVDAVLAGRFDLAIDSSIREEYGNVLRRPEFGFPQSRVDTLLGAIDRFALWVTAAPPCPVRPPDADDEPFLAVAAASERVLVTGTLRHFPARCRGGVRVQTPRQFYDDQR
jgi:uncharacterized protein